MAGLGSNTDPDPGVETPTSTPGPTVDRPTTLASRRVLGAARTGWGLIGAAAVVVGLAVGLLALIDRVGPAPTPVPLPTTPNIAIDVSTAQGVTELATFLDAHSNEVVRLDVRCFEVQGRRASQCLAESSGVDLTNRAEDGVYQFMWLFRGPPCFDHADEARDLEGCDGEVLLWIDPRTDGTTASVGNIEGAGSVAVRGEWLVKSPFGAGLFGPTVEGHELTAAP